jgi:hypothetical protein
LAKKKSLKGLGARYGIKPRKQFKRNKKMPRLWLYSIWKTSGRNLAMQKMWF